ncbi:MAG: ABC transporter permease [Candidatus Dormiibacterota bacterium]
MEEARPLPESNPLEEALLLALRSFRGITRNRAGLVGFIVLVALILLAFLGPLFTPANPDNLSAIYQTPSLRHPFGTDSSGRDVLLQIVDGGQPIFVVGGLAALLSTAIAIVLGSISAYVGGLVDQVILMAADIVLTIPQLALLAVLAAFVRLDNAFSLALLIAVLSWPVLMISIRSQVLSLKEREFVEAARMLDLGLARILFLEILPNMASFIAMNFVVGMTNAIYSQVALYLLGLAPLAGDNWGIMINLAWTRGAVFFKGSLMYILAPVLAISVVQLALVTFTRSLEDIFNPRLRGA